MNCVISCCRICELNSTRLASMEPSANTHAELTSHPPSENQTRCITTRVANIRISGLVTSDEPCDSSDEEVIEALNLCNPPNTCKKLSWSFCHSQSGSIGHAECLLYPYAVSYGSVVNTLTPKASAKFLAQGSVIECWNFQLSGTWKFCSREWKCLGSLIIGLIDNLQQQHNLNLFVLSMVITFIRLILVIWNGLKSSKITKLIVGSYSDVWCWTFGSSKRRLTWWRDWNQRQPFLISWGQ